jgi:hypothetical protein
MNDNRTIQAALRWLLQGTAQLLGSLLGLFVLLLIGTALGLVPPLWRGGEDLFPLMFGAVTLVVGIPFFFVVARVIFAFWRSGHISSLHLFGAGVIQGLMLYVVYYLILPLGQAAGFMNVSDTLTPFWILFGIAGTLSAGLAAALVAIASRYGQNEEKRSQGIQ